jgi:hypothetical protein
VLREKKNSDDGIAVSRLQKIKRLPSNVREWPFSIYRFFYKVGRLKDFCSVPDCQKNDEAFCLSSFSECYRFSFSPKKEQCAFRSNSHGHDIDFVLRGEFIV